MTDLTYTILAKWIIDSYLELLLNRFELTYIFFFISVNAVSSNITDFNVSIHSLKLHVKQQM